jgi:hypothetical protein
LGRLAGAVGLVADRGDAAPAEAEQMLGGLQGGGDVVYADMVARSRPGPRTFVQYPEP